MNTRKSGGRDRREEQHFAIESPPPHVIANVMHDWVNTVVPCTLGYVGAVHAHTSPATTADAARCQPAIAPPRTQRTRPRNRATFEKKNQMRKKKKVDRALCRMADGVWHHASPPKNTSLPIHQARACTHEERKTTRLPSPVGRAREALAFGVSKASFQQRLLPLKRKICPNKELRQ